jgi:glycosyltransferase involved in cell wall biosynthesis
VRFFIVGGALFGELEYEQHIRTLTEALGLSEVVTFTGFRTDVLNVVSQMDLIVHASTTGEPFGQVIIEGMAAGKPVVATNGGGVPEIVEDGKTGILIPMKDHEAMAEAIIRIVGDSDFATSLGDRGRTRILNNFTLEHTARKIESVYHLMLSEAN